MGLFNFKKKNKDEGLSGFEINQNPEDLKQDILGNKEDIPSLEKIPLPPQNNLDMPTPNIDETTFEEPKMTDEEPKELDDFAAPMEPGSMEEKHETETSDMSTELEPPKEEETTSIDTDVPEEEFSLPDFTDDEIKTEEEVEQLNNSPEETSFAAATEVSAIQPIMKNISKTTNKNQYLDINNCRLIFKKINLTEEVLEKTKESLQGHHGKNKTQLQNYKNIHDDLDKVQEKLMEIDSLLFEG